MRFALVGCGVIGDFHARAIAQLSPRARIVVAVDRDAARASEFAAEYGGDAVTSLNEALVRKDVDAVAICTPSGVHAEQAVPALEAGKHVVIEKPVDVSLEAARRIADAERRSDRTVTVISQHRFDVSSRFVHDAVRRGLLGRLTSAVATVPWWRSQDYYSFGNWRGTRRLDGGGALMNQGIHTIDLLVWMLGRPVEVFAWTDRLAHPDIEVEDTLVATVRFENGSLGVVHATTAAYPGLGARLDMHGDRGSAVIDNDRLVYFHSASAAREVAGDYGASGDGNQVAELDLEEQASGKGAASDPDALSDAHTDQYRDFLDAVATHRRPLVTVDEAVCTLSVILAIYESAATGRPAPVVGTSASRAPQPM